MTTKRISRREAINRTDEVVMEESAKAHPNIKSYSRFKKFPDRGQALTLSSVERLRLLRGIELAA